MADNYRPPRVPPVDQIGVEERAGKFQSRSIKTDSKVEGLKLITSMVDLTTLEGRDTPGKVRMLCRKAENPLDGEEDFPSVAAVCVYPNLVAIARDELTDPSINVASVATYFPSGQVPLDEKLEEVEQAVEQGADEIDVVINRGAFLSGDYQTVHDEVRQASEAAGDAHLKVILETGELQTYDNVRLASQIAIDAGADFIKTSTGKIKPAATMPVTLVMLETIRDHYMRTGERIGMKPAGGIRKSRQALRYLAMVKEVVGDEWLTPERFRFGASSLLNDVLLQVEKERTGRYHSDRYLSIS
ncbi:MAG: deoxyribose-phosphate aldolase [Bradymonadaceae bacterium]